MLNVTLIVNARDAYIHVIIGFTQLLVKSWHKDM